MLERGYRYAFVSNADNLGAVLDPRDPRLVRGAGARRSLMEVADRTRGRPQGRAPRAAAPDGGLVLREIAQTPDEDIDAFQDIDRHRFFNTNNLWLDLRALAAVMRERDGVARAADDRQPQDGRPGGRRRSPAVIQLETAMGAAIGVFEGARALRVPRTRFAAGQDDRRPARAALGRLRARRAIARDARAAAPRRGRRSSTSTRRFYKLVGDFEARFAARRAVARRVRAR